MREVILSVAPVTPEKNPGLLLRTFAVVGVDRLVTCDPTPERLAAAVRRLLDDQDFRVRTQQAGLNVASSPADHLALLLDAYDVSRRSHSPRRTGRR